MIMSTIRSYLCGHLLSQNSGRPRIGCGTHRLVPCWFSFLMHRAVPHGMCTQLAAFPVTQFLTYFEKNHAVQTCFHAYDTPYLLNMTLTYADPHEGGICFARIPQTILPLPLLLWIC